MNGTTFNKECDKSLCFYILIVHLKMKAENYRRGEGEGW